MLRIEHHAGFGGRQEVWQHDSRSTRTPMKFGIYLPRVNREQALMAMASVATVVRSSAVNYMGTEIGATVSIGLAPDAPQIPITSAFRRADACLYRAKAQGRDRCVIDDRLDEALASAA